MALRAAGGFPSGVQRHHSPDDRRQLLRPGVLRREHVFLVGRAVVRGSASFRPLPFLASSSDPLHGGDPRHRGAARPRHRAGDAAQGSVGFGLSRADGAAAPDPLERGRRDVEHHGAARHRAAWARNECDRLGIQLHAPAVRRLVHHRPHGCLALDVARGPPLLCGARLDSRRVLPGGKDRRRARVGRVPLHPAAEAEICADHRHSPPLHGFVHDLYGGRRRDRRRARERYDISVHRSREDGARPIRSRAGGGDVADLLPHNPAPELAVLHADDAERGEMTMRKRFLIPAVYIVFLLLPIYWLLNMSFKTTNEILGSFTLWPQTFTTANYAVIFTDPSWYKGYIASIEYVVINTILSVV